MLETPMGQAKSGSTMKVVVIVVVVAILLVALYLMMSKPANNYQVSQQQRSPATKVPEQNPAGITLPDQVYSYVGKVTSVGNGKVMVLAKATENALVKDSEIAVSVNESTQVIRRTIPRTLPSDGSAPVFKQEKITLTDVKVGDQVTAVAAENVRGKIEFSASRLEVLVVK